MTLCDCERSPQSLIAGPGCVCDREVLIRICFTPDHISSDGTLKEQAISREDIEGRVDDISKKPSRFLSVTREQYSCQEDLTRDTKNMHLKSKSKPTGASLFQLRTNDIRAIPDKKEDKAFCVFDDALPENIAHAGVAGSKKRGKGQVLLLRSALVKKMKFLRKIV